MVRSESGRKRVCFVGCGKIAAVHARNLKGQVDLCFCSRSRSSAEELNASTGGTGVFDSFDEMLDSSVKAAVVCSPPEHHAEQVVRLLGAGKSVMVEKPMCASADEVEEIAAAAGGSDAFVMVAENYYYKPSLLQTKRMLSEGWLGAIRRISIRKTTAQAVQGWREGHGSLLEGGIHFVALLSDLAEGRPEQVRAEFPGHTSGGPERHAILQTDYADGLRATLEYAWDTPSPTKGTFQHSQIECANGRIVFESNGLYTFARSGMRCRIHGPSFGDLLGYRGMARDFIACLHDPDRRPYSDLDRARRDLGIVFEAYSQLPGAA